MNTALITREHNGHSFTFREDGWFNMTKAAQHFGKQLNNFWVSPETKEYMAALASTLNSKDQELVQAIPGNRYTPNRGTWAHPKLAIFFARWLDVRFAVWCDAVIEDILTKKAEEMGRTTPSNR